MIEIQCPQCLQYWYRGEDEPTRRKLCPACRDRRRMERPAGSSPARVKLLQLGVFAIVAAVLLVVDGVWIVLTACWPDTFGPVMLIYGGTLLFPSAVWMSVVLRAFRWGWGGELDWNIHKWPAMIGLMGLACVLAFFSLRHYP